MAIAHVVNLSRGVLCPHVTEEQEVSGAIRIQSTHCEQKDWVGVLRGLGPTFWIAAVHYPVVVHDHSEKPRETRAMWQGLSWVRYVAYRVLFKTFTLEFSRNGMLVSPYWEQQYRQLPDSIRNEVKYYRKFLSVTEEEFSLSSCWRR